MMIHRNGKISHVHGLEELVLLKCPYDPKQSINLQQSLSKYPRLFHRTGTNNPQIYMEPQKIIIAKAIQRKKNKAGGIMLPEFRLNYVFLSSRPSKVTIKQVSYSWLMYPGENAFFLLEYS